jgi:AcrR family transcriptional regulator
VLIDGCVRIADAEGTDAVTLRRLGAELGVDPTAVYRHFRDKHELLTATADHLLMAALDDIELSGDWRADMRAFALRIRQVYLAHPGFASFVATAPGPLPNEARLSEAALGIISRAGFSETKAISVFEVLEAYTVGVSAMDAIADAHPTEAWRHSYAAMSRADYPHLTATAHLLYQDSDARFAYGLDALIRSFDDSVAT